MAMTGKARTPDLYIMDSLANDIEDLDAILRMLNSDTVLGWHQEWGRAFERSEVVEALSRMIRGGLVQVFVIAEDAKELTELPVGTLPPGDYADVYFGLTPRGRLIHGNWHPDLG